MSSGQKHLGAALGSTEFIKKFVKKKRLLNGVKRLSVYLTLRKGSHKLHTLPSYMEYLTDGIMFYGRYLTPLNSWFP